MTVSEWHRAACLSKTVVVGLFRKPALVTHGYTPLKNTIPQMNAHACAYSENEKRGDNRLDKIRLLPEVVAFAKSQGQQAMMPSDSNSVTN